MNAPFNLTSKLTAEQVQDGLDDLTLDRQDRPKDGDSGEFTLLSLWRELSDRGDIIIVIDIVDEPRVRKQLSALKAKENAKLKSADIPIDDKTLEFAVHDEPTLKAAGQIKIQIYLKAKPTIKLHKFIVPKEL